MFGSRRSTADLNTPERLLSIENALNNHGPATASRVSSEDAPQRHREPAVEKEAGRHGRI